MRASGSFPSFTLRVGPGVLIILAHLVLLAVLIRYAGTPPVRGEAGPATYIAVTLVPAQTKPRPAETLVATAPPAPRKREIPAQPDAPAPVAAQVPAAAPERPEAEPGQAPPQGIRLDMAALRADARRLAGDHVPGPFEQVRDAEHRLEAEKNDLGRAISKAKRPPCTKKYSGGTSLNLFALIPLAIDTITDTGCKW
jgi:hypothetical protein